MSSHQNYNESVEARLAEEFDKIISQADGKELCDIIQEFERTILDQLSTKEKIEPKKINPNHYSDIQKLLETKIIKTIEVNTRHHHSFWSCRIYGVTEADIRYDKWHALQRQIKQEPTQANQLQVKAEYIKIALNEKESLRRTATQECLERKRTFSILFSKPNSLVNSLPGELVKEIVRYIKH
jgi:hypothetical protein